MSTEEENIKKGPSELEELQKKADEYLNNWKRSAADFINYKKDEVQRAGLLVNYAKEDVIYNILPILDNIYLSEKQLPEKLKEGKEGSPESIEWTKGFLQIQNQIKDFLKKEGIEEIEALDKPFDPAKMEAVGEEDGDESGKVVEELQKGYQMSGKVLRPAKVKVIK
ncbi:MAG: nucleotide exchange factor GrpE [bacterium]|nr:nucleotide exchange factor GrpE [bacterium]